MMTSGLTRRQTYEEVLDYIENDPDKIKYPQQNCEILKKYFSVISIRWNGSSTF